MASLEAGATLKIDILEGVRWREEQGVIKEVSRLAIVSDLEPGTIGEQVIADALNDLNMPQPGDGHPLLTGLVLADRFPIARDPTIIQIELRYKIPGLIDPPPPGAPWTIEGGTALDQIQTYKNAANGEQIILTHNGVPQGGHIVVVEPMREITFGWVRQSLDPYMAYDGYVGKLNDAPFIHGRELTWMCMSAPFTLIDPNTNPPTWKFSMTFNHKDDGSSPVIGHQPQAVYIDPDTGQPPPGLVPDEGFQVIPYYQVANFNSLP